VYVANRTSNDVSGFQLIPATGVLAPVPGSPYGAPFGTTQPASVVIDPTGRFVYVADSGTNQVAAYGIAPKSGALTLLGSPFAAGLIPTALAISD
jgi:6-phosphogluconolactonase